MPNTSQLNPLRLNLLYEVSRKINSELNLEKLLNEIMDQAIALLNAEKGVVLLKSPDTNDLVVQVARSMEQQHLADAMKMSYTVVDRVEKEGKPVLLQNVPDIAGGDATKSMVMYRLKSIICVPLFAKDVLIGTIYLDTKNTAHFFREADVPFLEAFANLAGIAIENARHYQQIADLNANLEKKVAQRTKELSEKNRELTDAYQKLKDTQIQLIRSEKMASLGQLSAGVAHEINNPLGSLNGNMDIFVRGMANVQAGLEGDDEAVKTKALKNATTLVKLAEVSKEACERIAIIVRALKNFARLDEEEAKLVDIHEGLESTLILLENKYRDRIKIVKNYAPLPEYFCQAAQLNQVFINILINACEAIEAEGEIHIETAQESENIRISIRDTGKGIAEADKEKIFDPGFTTKGVRVGVGLGLAIAYKIVEDHNGHIRVESEAGQGSTFHIYLGQSLKT